MSLRLSRPRQRRVAAVTALVLVLGIGIVMRTQIGVLAAETPVPGEIAFSRSPAPSTPSLARSSPPTSPQSFERRVTAAGGAPASPTHLARVVATPPYRAAGPFASMPTVAEFDPVWSPDGERIAYSCAAEDSSGTAICVADGDGGNARTVTAPPRLQGVAQNDGQPAWSPDGARLAFTRVLGRVFEGAPGASILTVPADGAEGDTAAVVRASGVWASHPSWSPDGGRIAYRHEGFDGSAERWIARIASVAPDGTGKLDLTDGPDDADPAYSPDGRSLAYVERYSERMEHGDRAYGGGTLAVLDVSAGTSTPLVLPDGGELGVELAADPAWSPDGVTILYTWWTSYNDTGDIRSVPAADGPETPVVAGDTDDRNPTWRPTADLHVTIAAAPEPLQFGRPATIVATVTNGGPAPARSAELTVQLPADFPPSAVEPATCDVDAGQVTCRLGDVGAGASATVRITGRPDTFGTVLIVADAESRTADLDPTDNTVRGRFRVQGTDLAVTTAGPAGPALLGEVVTYAVTVRRVAGDGVTGAAVDVTLPDNVTFVDVDSGTGTVCTPTPGGPVRCALAPLGFESDDSITVVVHATATTLGERPGSAQVSSPTLDVNPANDTSAFTTRVVGAELAVAKQAPASAVVGEEFSYEIGVRNGGERSISGATLVDEVPAGLMVIAAESAWADCTVTASPAAVVCSLPPLPGVGQPPAPGATDGTPTPGGTDASGPPGGAPDPPPDVVPVRLRVRATTPGPIRNAACVRAVLPPVPRPGPGGPASPLQVFEDCDDVTTQVHGGDLAVAVTTKAPVGYVGGRIDATVAVRNAGAATVPAAVRLLLPATACETPAAGGCTAGTRDVPLGLLAPGAAISVPVRLVPVAPGPATVAARALPATFDLTDRNDRAAATVSIKRPNLVVNPPIGPPGFVTSVRGNDFPPAASVRLVWSRGLTLTGRPIVVRPDGTFEAPMPVAARDDALGHREVVAVTAELPTVTVGFLAVPSTVDPPDFAVRG